MESYFFFYYSTTNDSNSPLCGLFCTQLLLMHKAGLCKVDLQMFTQVAIYKFAPYRSHVYEISGNFKVDFQAWYI